MKENTITVRGQIRFDPKNLTKKHQAQGSWKKVAMVFFHKSDLCGYYAWFIKKRYNLPLAEPARLPHVSFVNDRESDTNGKWGEVKKKWHGKTIEVTLSTDVLTDATHWWMMIPHAERGELQNIRNELGLGKPFYGLHMSIGYARNSHDDVDHENNAEKAIRMNEAHSKYIHELIKKGRIT